MKQELIDRMVFYIKNSAGCGCDLAKEIVAELDKPDYLVIAREIRARADEKYDELYRCGDLDDDPGVQYALEQLERAAGLRA